MEKVKKKQRWRKCGICKHIVVWQWGSKPERCPACESIKWDKPKDEAVLFNLQEKYLKTRDNKILGQMFILLKEYARRVILKNLIGHVKYDENTIDEKSSDTANKLVEYFLEKPTFSIQESWGYYLDLIAKQNMFAKKLQRRDKNELSIEKFKEDHEDNSTAYDTVEMGYNDKDFQFENEIIDVLSREYLVEEVGKFVETMFNILTKEYGYKQAYLVINLFSKRLNGNSKRYIKRYLDYYGQKLKENYEKANLSIYQFLQGKEKKLQEGIV